MLLSPFDVRTGKDHDSISHLSFSADGKLGVSLSNTTLQHLMALLNRRFNYFGQSQGQRTRL
jgi:hypothetical protein